MSEYGVKPVFGGAGIGRSFADPKSIEEVYQELEKYGCKNIDTARLYGSSEELMGQTGAGGRFIIDSKTPGGFGPPGECTSTGILQHAKETIERLKVKSIDIYYIHAPDHTLDLEDMLAGINEAHKNGYFKRFGLSNFTAADVKKAHAICKSKGYILPSVFQGNYSAVARRQETELFPTLRELGMAFYAYSPIAGGFLAKSKEQIAGGGEAAGRFDSKHEVSKLYNALYTSKPSYLKALDLWSEAAEAAGCSRAELAYRWVAFDSPMNSKYGDACIFGCSKISQVGETLNWLKKGSVGKEANDKINQIWEAIKDEAPLDNFNSYRWTS